MFTDMSWEMILEKDEYAYNTVGVDSSVCTCDSTINSEYYSGDMERRCWNYD